MIKEMKQYVGIKVLGAVPMTKKEYCDYIGWDVPENEDANEEVYLVEYEADENSKPNHPNHKGYISMSPKHVFERAYLKIVTSVEDSLGYLIDKNYSSKKLHDGYHTFEELYDFRKMYNAVLFNEWGKPDSLKYDVHKSWNHNDGEPCFGGGWFVVVAILPDGQITNHYKAEDWGLFNIPETDKAKYEFDGHTGKDVLERLKKLCHGS